MDYNTTVLSIYRSSRDGGGYLCYFCGCITVYSTLRVPCLSLFASTTTSSMSKRKTQASAETTQARFSGEEDQWTKDMDVEVLCSIHKKQAPQITHVYGSCTFKMLSSSRIEVKNGKRMSRSKIRRCVELEGIWKPEFISDNNLDLGNLNEIKRLVRIFPCTRRRWTFGLSM